MLMVFFMVLWIIFVRMVGMTVAMGIGVEFINAFLRTEIEHLTGVFACGDCCLLVNPHTTDWVFNLSHSSHSFGQKLTADEQVIGSYP